MIGEVWVVPIVMAFVVAFGGTVESNHVVKELTILRTVRLLRLTRRANEEQEISCFRAGRGRKGLETSRCSSYVHRFSSCFSDFLAFQLSLEAHIRLRIG